MVTSVRKATPLLEDMTIKDFMSTIRGNFDGVSLCGPRVYSLTCGCTSAIAALTTTTYTGDTLSIQSFDTADATSKS